MNERQDDGDRGWSALLSTSLLREQGKGALPADVEPWMLDTTAWPGTADDYVDPAR